MIFKKSASPTKDVVGTKQLKHLGVGVGISYNKRSIRDIEPEERIGCAMG